MKNRKAGDFLIGKIVFVVFFSAFCFINDIALDHGIVTEVQGIRAKNKNLVIDISDVIKNISPLETKKVMFFICLKHRNFLFTHNKNTQT